MKVIACPTIGGLFGSLLSLVRLVSVVGRTTFCVNEALELVWLLSPL